MCGVSFIIQQKKARLIDSIADNKQLPLNSRKNACRIRSTKPAACRAAFYKRAGDTAERRSRSE